jgi:anhydro-N-acetylmuramic acid kinase
MTTELFIGLMSGTSLDGVDGVIAEFGSGPQTRSPGGAPSFRVIASGTAPFADSFRAELLALNTPGDNELHRAAVAANRLAQVYADVVHGLLEKSNLAAGRIVAIGAHGQTVRHQPQGTQAAEAAEAAYTLQLNNPARLAELTGIDVIADFRSRDVAAGGQGAPLAPAFHQFLFAQPDEAVAVLNLGGISNLTLLPPLAGNADAEGRTVIGFDCGAGNALIDAWCQRHTGEPFDAGGAWAASGKLIPDLLTALLANDYFALPPPKSTGRDLFSLAWLEAQLAPFAAQHKPEDIQHTLAEFTVSPCISGVNSYGKESRQLIVCGGGAYNAHVMARLAAGLPGVDVRTSEAHGLPPLQVEASAFAWLARQRVLRAPGNLPGVTGAAGSRVLGALYAA